MDRSRTVASAGINICKRAATGLAVIVLCAVIYWAIPPNTIGPLCTHRLQYRLDAVIQVGDEIIKSSVVHQLAQPRKWIGSLQSCGSEGNTIAFKTKEGRVFIFDSRICRDSEDAFHATNRVDVIKYCSSFWKNKLVGFTINSASEPTSWQNSEFLNGESNIKLISMFAEKTWRHPYSSIKEVAPNISKTRFDYDGEWNSTPARFTSRKENIIFRARQIRGYFSISST